MGRGSVDCEAEISPRGRTRRVADGVLFPRNRVSELRVDENVRCPESPVRSDGARKLKAILLIIAPWLIILSLVYMAFFTHPGKLGKTIVAPPISTIDRFYGVTRVDENIFWLAGNFGKIVKSSDGGKHWVEQPTHSDENLQSIAAWNPSDAVAVGNNATVLVTHDSGQIWNAVKDVPHSKVFNKFLNVRIMTGGQAWIVGENGTILSSTDQGATWQRMRAPVETTFYDISGVGDELWVVGEFGTVLFSNDDGLTWSKLDTGTTSTLTAVAFRDADHGVAVGLDGVILATSDGGQSWQKISGVSAADHFLAVSWNGTQWLATGSGGIVATSDAAASTWQQTQLGVHNFSWHTSVVPDQENNGWLLVGSTVGIFAGNKWHRLSSAGEGNSHG